MADNKSLKSEGENPKKKLAEQAKSVLRACRAQKARTEGDLKEALFFIRPRLSVKVDSKSVRNAKDDIDNGIDELATGIGAEVAEDFATEMMSAFFPKGTDWVESSAAGLDLEAPEKADLERDAKARNGLIFGEIRRSNFEAEMGSTLDPHGSLGTIGLWIERKHTVLPIECSHIPVNELEINVGANGEVDERCRVRHVRWSKLKRLIGDVPLPKKVQDEYEKRKKNPKANEATVEVDWIYWRIDDSDPDLAWQFVLLVDGEYVDDMVLTGEGSCPILVMRLAPDVDFAWGNGPSIKALQEYRVLDVITAGIQDSVDIAIRPPIGYPDDGVMDFEGGIESGKAYPMRPGSGRDIANLAFEGSFDISFYTASDLERRIRRKHFADYPEQKGDTPPTATQWVDEMLRAQRRIGTQGNKFWREGPREVFLRFTWLMEADGILGPLEVDGERVTLEPNNPATQAADAQKLETAVNLTMTVKNLFPMTSQAAIDEYKTIENMKKLSRDETVVMRDSETAGRLVESILTAAQSMNGEGDGGEDET